MTIPLCSSEHLFVTGSIVEVTTAHKEVITGEVHAFDYDSRLLILKVANPSASKTPSSSSSSNITILNLSFCSEIKPLSTPEPDLDPNSAPSSKSKLPDIDFRKLEHRLERAVEERNALARNFESGAGTGGVLLYYQLSKTFGAPHVKWLGEQIVVKDSVAIAAPYRAAEVALAAGGKEGGAKDKGTEESVQYIKNVVDKFWAESERNAGGKGGNKKSKD